MTKEAMAGVEKGDGFKGIRSDFVELDADCVNRPSPRIRIDGPYGAPAEDVFDNEVAILIGAGIGVTPFASILRHIWYRQQRGSVGPLRKVEFFWVCRDTPSFGWFQSLLHEIEVSQSDPNFLRINIYLTQKVAEDMFWNIVVNDPGAEYDPLTLLHTRTIFGRPDWKCIYRRIQEAIEIGQYLPGREAQLRTRVGTYFCGPSGLAATIKEATRQHTSQSVVFSFSKEHF